jgi:hypothetical protein
VRDSRIPRFKNFLVTSCLSWIILSLTGLIALSQTDIPIQIYTFRADPGIKIGYPSGWIVQETEMGVVVQERNDADTAGLILFLIPLDEGMTSEQLSEHMISLLREGAYPDFTPIRREPHPEVSEIHTLDATLTADGLSFKVHTWCLADEETGVGIFSGFYAPSYRYDYFNAQELLTSCMAPLFR